MTGNVGDLAAGAYVYQYGIFIAAAAHEAGLTVADGNSYRDIVPISANGTSACGGRLRYHCVRCS